MAACGSYGGGMGNPPPPPGAPNQLNAHIVGGELANKTCGKFVLETETQMVKCEATVPVYKTFPEKYPTGKMNPPCPAKVPDVQMRQKTISIPYRVPVKRFNLRRTPYTKTCKKRVQPGDPSASCGGDKSCLKLPPRTIYVDITYQKDDVKCQKVPYTDYVSGVATKTISVPVKTMVPNNQQCPEYKTKFVKRLVGHRKEKRDCKISKPVYKWKADDLDNDGVNAEFQSGGGGGGYGGAAMGGGAMAGGAAMGGAMAGGAMMVGGAGGVMGGGAMMGGGAAMGGAVMEGGAMGGAAMMGGGAAMGGAAMGGVAMEGGGALGGMGGPGAQMGQYATEFQALDKNNDGKISLAEYSAARGGGGGGGGGGYGGAAMGGGAMAGGAAMGGGAMAGGAAMGGASMAGGAAMGGAAMGGAMGGGAMMMGGGGGGGAMTMGGGTSPSMPMGGHEAMGGGAMMAQGGADCETCKEDGGSGGGASGGWKAVFPGARSL